MSDIIEQNNAISPENAVKTPDQPQEICSCSVCINGALQAKISSPANKLLLADLIIGAVFLVGFIVLFVLNGEVLGGKKFVVDNFLLILLLVCGAILFGMGIALLILNRKNVKNAEALSQENFYRFYPDHVLVRTMRKGETLGEVKQYYASFVKVREKKDFFFLYPNNVTLFPVPKSELTGEQIEALRRVLPLKRHF